MPTSVSPREPKLRTFLIVLTLIIAPIYFRFNWSLGANNRSICIPSFHPSTNWKYTNTSTADIYISRDYICEALSIILSSVFVLGGVFFFFETTYNMAKKNSTTSPTKIATIPLLLYLIILLTGSPVQGLGITLNIGILLPFTSGGVTDTSVKARETAIRIAIEEINANTTFLQPQYLLNYTSLDTERDPGVAISKVMNIR